MASYEQLPGALSLAFRGGDRLSTEIDFSPISLTGFTMSATITSLVSGQVVGEFATELTDAAAGKVRISLTREQTGAMAPGTYRWSLAGSDAASARRSYLAGFVEVTR